MAPKPPFFFPPPARFALLLVDEPRALLQDFLERFQSLCQLELQLPSLRAEDMKTMVSSSLPWFWGVWGGFCCIWGGFCCIWGGFLWVWGGFCHANPFPTRL